MYKYETFGNLKNKLIDQYVEFSWRFGCYIPRVINLCELLNYQDVIRINHQNLKIKVTY